MQWWCSASNAAWSWTWRPYAGVWLFIAALGVGYALLLRAAPPPEGAAERRERRWRTATALGGLLLLWIALDWPVGTLGAGYLASVHMLQFLSIAMTIPLLLLLGIPPAVLRRAADRAPAVLARVGRALTQPFLALVVFNAMVVITHAPPTVDGLMRTQGGSFGFDLIWLVGGALFWWPLVCPVPRRPRFAPPLRIAYVLVGTVVHTGVAMYLMVTRYPVYGIYELAPPIPGLSALGDQEIAGGLMLFGGMAIAAAAAGVIFFRWHDRDEGTFRPRAPTASPYPR